MKDLATAILNIFKYAGKFLTALRNIFINVLFFTLLVFIAFSFLTTEEATVEDGSALLLSIAGDIVEERQITDPIGEFFDDTFGFSNLPNETLLQDVIDAIDTASTDKRIRAIVLDLSNMGSGSINQLRDIGSALKNFRDSGKKVIAAEDFYSQSRYFLASYADTIFLNPIGVVDLHGFASYRLYFKEALEKLKVNYHVFRIGTFKSALEPVTRNSMSEEAKSQNRAWLDVLWQQYVTDITDRRGIDRETINHYTNNVSSLLQQHGGDTAELALQTRLVDDLKTRQQLWTYLAEMTGESISGGFKYVRLKKYLKEVKRSYITRKPKDTVGIIVAQGNILTGEQPPGTIGSDSLVLLLREARNDSHLKAIVLRINSGGGSVVASEIIRRELQELKKAGKTFVVSMGSMAASGGYWIAAEADEIWAHPTTLTGSIGIFGAIPTFENSLAHLGVYSDGVGTTNLAAGLNLSQPLSEEVKESIQMNIEHGYKKFLAIVANGRGIADDKLELVAQGRVFDGIKAQELGLVDELGNLEDAIGAAAALEGLDNYSVRYIRTASSFSEKFLENLQKNIQSLFPGIQLPKVFAHQIKQLTETAAQLPLFEDPKGLYAHCLIHYF